MNEYAKVHLQIKTYTSYAVYLQRINQAIGDIRLKNLTPINILQFINNLEEDGISKRVRRDEQGAIIGNGRLSPKTVLSHFRLISKILATAVKWGFQSLGGSGYLY